MQKIEKNQKNKNILFHFIVSIQHRVTLIFKNTKNSFSFSFRVCPTARVV